MWIIYKHTNKINGKSYIGQTKKSMYERAGMNGEAYASCSEFYGAIREYGWDNFEHTVLQENIATREEADTQERYWIKFYNTFERGYNLTLGGRGNTTSSYPPKVMEYKELLKTVQISKELLDFIREHSNGIIKVNSIKEFINGCTDTRDIYIKETTMGCVLIIRFDLLEAFAQWMQDGDLFWTLTSNTKRVHIVNRSSPYYFYRYVIAYYKNGTKLRGLQTQVMTSKYIIKSSGELIKT